MLEYVRDQIDGTQQYVPAIPALHAAEVNSKSGKSDYSQDKYPTGRAIVEMRDQVLHPIEGKESQEQADANKRLEQDGVEPKRHGRTFAQMDEIGHEIRCVRQK